jgi:hypothetical protein
MKTQKENAKAQKKRTQKDRHNPCTKEGTQKDRHENARRNAKGQA